MVSTSSLPLLFISSLLFFHLLLLLFASFSSSSFFLLFFFLSLSLAAVLFVLSLHCFSPTIYFPLSFSPSVSLSLSLPRFLCLSRALFYNFLGPSFSSFFFRSLAVPLAVPLPFSLSLDLCVSLFLFDICIFISLLSLSALSNYLTFYVLFHFYLF